MNLVVRLLTEMLEVRILPGEPKLFNLNKLQSLGRAFGSRPNAWDVKRKSLLAFARFCRPGDSRLSRRLLLRSDPQLDPFHPFHFLRAGTL